AISVAGLWFRQQSTVSNTYYSGFSTDSYESSAKLSLTGLTACLSFRAPQARGIFLSVEGGVGFGMAKTETHVWDEYQPSNNLDAYGEWDGAAPIAAIFPGLERVPRDGLLFSAKGGYRFQNLGERDGRLTTPQQGTSTGPPLNNA